MPLARKRRRGDARATATRKGRLMAHALKITAAKMHGIFRHCERGIGDNVQERRNLEIDGKRTHRNYDIISGATAENYIKGALQKRWEARCEKLHAGKARKNRVVAVNWVVTLPAELKDATEEKQRDFFMHTVEFMRRRYGADNIVGAWVHNDETTPHVHVTIVPESRVLHYKELPDGKKRNITDYNNFQGTGKIVSRDLMTRREMLTFHPDLQNYLQQQMGMALSILNEATAEAGGNQSIEAMKRRTRRQQAALAKQAEKQRAAVRQAVASTNKLAGDVGQVSAAAAQFTEAARAAAAQFTEAAQDMQAKHERGGWLKSGWERRADAARDSAATVSKVEESVGEVVQAMHKQHGELVETVKQARGIMELVPIWAKSPGEEMAAALSAAAAARKKAEAKEKELIAAIREAARRADDKAHAKALEILGQYREQQAIWEEKAQAAEAKAKEATEKVAALATLTAQADAAISAKAQAEAAAQAAEARAQAAAQAQSEAESATETARQELQRLQDIQAETRPEALLFAGLEAAIQATGDWHSVRDAVNVAVWQALDNGDDATLEALGFALVQAAAPPSQQNTQRLGW